MRPETISGAAPHRVHRLYKITPQQELYLLEHSGWKCRCCRADLPRNDRGNRPIDHDHETGEVRGVLCRRCNTVIGQLGDRADLVEERSKQILHYLRSGAALTRHLLADADRLFPSGRPITWTMRLARLLWSDCLIGFEHETDVFVEQVERTARRYALDPEFRRTDFERMQREMPEPQAARCIAFWKGEMQRAVLP